MILSRFFLGSVLAFHLAALPAPAQYGELPFGPDSPPGTVAPAPGPSGKKAMNVTASLEAGTTAWVAGQPADIALKLEHPEHWHTYWLNPGIGLPTQLNWQLPAGWTATPLMWPVPKVKSSELGNLHIYENTVHLFTTVTPPPGLPAGQPCTLKASAKWLVCDEGSTCNPGGAELEITLPAAATAQPVEAVQALLAEVKAAQPQNTPAWQVRLEPKWTLTLTPSAAGGAVPNPDPGEIYFFDVTKNVTTDPPAITREGPLIRLNLKPADDEAADPPAPSGFVYASKGWLKDGSLPALAVGQPADGSAPAAPGTDAAAASPGAGTKGKTTFLVSLGSLFLAGALLNLMPCVFPVLALKVLSFARQAGKDPAETRKHSLAYTLGLLVFVWLVAGGMFIAKSAFHLELAWGDITRYTGALAAVVIVLFLLALNLAGVFEIGTSLGNVGSGLQDKKGYAGSFWSGALTMLISTPCSGPFMAVAMGWALQQGPAAQFVLFTSFGLGIAAPYVVLSSSPRLLKALPRPGAWMETFKKALAFPMFIAAVYFFNAFTFKAGEESSSRLLWSLIPIAGAAWIYGHWCPPSRSTRSRISGGLAALLTLAGGLWLAHGAVNWKPANFPWIKWSPKALADERARNRAVFVNYTTIGCITCDTNDARHFNPAVSGTVLKKFRELDIAPLKAKYLADGTPEDEAIRESLKPWDLSTFPVYIMYPADPSKPPFVVSDSLLSQNEIIAALEKATQ